MDNQDQNNQNSQTHNVVVMTPVRHDGKVYFPGEVIQELEDSIYLQLKAAKAILDQEKYDQFRSDVQASVAGGAAVDTAAADAQAKLNAAATGQINNTPSPESAQAQQLAAHEAGTLDPNVPQSTPATGYDSTLTPLTDADVNELKNPGDTAETVDEELAEDAKENPATPTTNVAPNSPAADPNALAGTPTAGVNPAAPTDTGSSNNPPVPQSPASTDSTSTTDSTSPSPVNNADGSTTVTNADGSQTTTNADGTPAETNPDGSPSVAGGA